MPTVQLYGQRRVATDALPGVRRTAAETPLSLGAGLEEARAQKWGAIGNAAEIGLRTGVSILDERTRIQIKARKRADDIATMGLENQVDNAITTILYGDNKDVRGALQAKGEEAFGTPEQVSADFTKAVDEIGRGATTPEQRQAFAALVDKKKVGLRLTVQRNVDQQIDAVEAGALTSLVSNKTSHAIANSLTGEIAGQDIADAVAAIRRSGPRLGWTPDQIEEKVAATQSHAVSGILKSLLAQDLTPAARAYFKANSDLLQDDELISAQKALKEGSTRADAQKAADAILAGGGTPTEQLKAASAIKDPEVRDATEARLEHQHALNERAGREQHSAAVRGVYDVIEKGTTLSGLERLPIWQDMEGGERAAAKRYLEDKVQGVPRKTDAGTWYALMEQARTEPEKFLKQDLLNYASKLSEEDGQALERMKLSIGKGGPDASPELAGFSTRTQIVNDALDLYGIPSNAKPDSPEGKAIAQLHRMLDRRVDAAQQPGVDGKRVKVSNAEMQQTVDELLSQSTTIPGSWWNLWPGGKRVSDTTAPLMRTTIGDVPAAERTKIEGRLRARGRTNVSEQMILDVYLESQIK